MEFGILRLTIRNVKRRLNHIGALIIRTGFWGPLYYNYIIRNLNNVDNHLGPMVASRGGC